MRISRVLGPRPDPQPSCPLQFREGADLPETVPHFCSDWAMYEQLGLMQKFIAIGIELQLFSWYECDSIFWYWDYLLSARLRLQTNFAATRQQVERQKAAIAAAEAQEAAEAADRERRAKNKKKGKKDKKAKKAATDAAAAAAAAAAPPEEPLDTIEHVTLEIHRLQCRGVFRFMAALVHGDLVTKPQFALAADPELRFIHRFAAFSPVTTPQHLTYDMFAESCDFSDYKPEQLFQASSDCFREVVKWVDALQYCPDVTEQIIADYTALKKVAVSNRLAIAQVLRAGGPGGTGGAASGSEGGGGSEIDFQYEIHPYHPKIVLKPTRVLKSV